jgi:hypothetical protein
MPVPKAASKRLDLRRLLRNGVKSDLAKSITYEPLAERNSTVTL